MDFPTKLKLIRKVNHLTQAALAKKIGVSRGNIANIELGNVKPTKIFINCLVLTFHVDKKWLLDDTDDSLDGLNTSNHLLSLIVEKYDKLDDNYKNLVENQINQLLEIQKNRNDTLK